MRGRSRVAVDPMGVPVTVDEPGERKPVSYEEACAEVAACLDFLACEMGWEYFGNNIFG